MSLHCISAKNEVVRVPASTKSPPRLYHIQRRVDKSTPLPANYYAL